LPGGYDETHEAAWVEIPGGDTQTAALQSGAGWSDNYGEAGVGEYLRGYTYDKVGARTSMTLVDEDGVVSRDEDWAMEHNDLNQLDRRYDGASWSGADGDVRWDYTCDDNGNLTQAKQEAQASGVWSETSKWVYEWNPRDQN